MISYKETFWEPMYDIEFSRYDAYEAFGDRKASLDDGYCKQKGHIIELVILHPSKEVICPVCFVEKRNREEGAKIRPIRDRFEIMDLGDENES